MAENYRRDLGSGLVLRRATRADADALAQFNGTIHRSDQATCINQSIVALVQDMAGRPHPTMQEGDFTLVEDTSTRRIVSSLCLIDQTWSYAGIPFGVGRPELVGTNPDYRNRGLVRTQFDEIHRWSAERGQLVQGITGIPYYYRQYGYEYAINLGGGRSGALFDVPVLPDGAEERFKSRPAQVSDIPFLKETYALGCARSLVNAVRDDTTWRYDLEGRSLASDSCAQIVVLETPDNQAVGFIHHNRRVQHGGLATSHIEVANTVSWLDISPFILRYLKQYGEREIAASNGTAFTYLMFYLSADHPFFAATGRRLPNVVPEYAWYIRVPDIPGFIRHITPVLEDRLAASSARSFSGEIKLSFFRSGMLLKFTQGKLAVEDWTPSPSDWGPARFPNLTFLQLLFGFRTIPELQMAYPDCSAQGDSSLVLAALFPKQSSSIWALE